MLSTLKYVLLCVSLATRAYTTARIHFDKLGGRGEGCVFYLCIIRGRKKPSQWISSKRVIGAQYYSAQKGLQRVSAAASCSCTVSCTRFSAHYLS